MITLHILRRLLIVAAIVWLAAACGDEGQADDAVSDVFGPIDGQLADSVGQELAANTVVGLPCIPSRRDPIGMWIALRIDSATAQAESFTLGLEQTDARFGSHPSGCSSPELLLAQSVFLVADADPIFVARQSVVDGITVVEFDIAEVELQNHSLVVLPTYRYSQADGTLETSVFGRVGRYSLAGS